MFKDGSTRVKPFYNPPTLLLRQAASAFYFSYLVGWKKLVPWLVKGKRTLPTAAGAIGMAFWLAGNTYVQRRAGTRLFQTVAVYGLATALFGLSTSLVLSLACLVVVGAADMVSVVVRQSLVQLETPDEMRGRVSAVNGTFIQASNQLGDFRAGAIAAMVGPVGSVLVGAAGTLLVVALWIRFFPPLVHRDRMRN